MPLKHSVYAVHSSIECYLERMRPRIYCTVDLFEPNFEEVNECLCLQLVESLPFLAI